MTDDAVDLPGGEWDDGSELDDDGAAELAGSAWVSCPYCGVSVELLLDSGGGALQEYVEDCEVCCRPWSVRVEFGWDGRPSVAVTTLDDV